MIKKLPIGIVILFILFSFLLAINWQIISNLSKFKDLTLKKITIDGKNYALSNGNVYEGDKQLFWTIPGQREKIKKVVNLAGFYMWNKEDPLFDSPDLDVDEFKKSVSILKDEQLLFLKSFKQTIRPYPSEFLNQFVKVAFLNRDFMENPSLQKANELIKEQKRAASIYKKESATLRSFLLKKNLKAITFNLQFSTKTVTDDLEKISINSDSILEELSKREKCLTGMSTCTRPALFFNKPASTTPQTNIDAPDTILSPDLFYLQPSNVRGPYSTTTFCLGWGDNFTKPLNYFYIANSNGRLPHINIQLATDIFFRRLYTAYPAEKKLAEQGIKYIFNGTTAPYQCPDRNFFAEISEIDIFLETKRPILQNIGLPDVSAKTFEEAFFEQKYPSFKTLSYLSDIYGYIYRQMVENPDKPWVKNSLPYKDELLERHLSIHRKIGNLPLVLNSHIFHIKGARERQELEQQTDDVYIKGFLYTFRNFYGLTFFPFTPSVWREHYNLAYVDRIKITGVIDLNGAFLSYHQAKKIYSQEEIQTWIDARITLNKK